MKTFTIVSDPNYSLGGSADFRVHAKGCRDVARHTSHPRFNLAGSAYDVQAETAEAAVAAEVQVFQDQGQDYGPGNFHICNCCKS